MSSIKKKFNGKWEKFAETFNSDASESINIEEINTKLNQHNDEIEKLKRNVAWLALHGGGGSGSGGSGGATRKANCKISVNNQTSNIAISDNTSLSIKLFDITGTKATIPWTVVVKIDSTVFIDKQFTGSNEIDLSLPWDNFKYLFSNENKTRIRQLSITATYSDAETMIEGLVILNTTMYIPIINTSISFNNNELIYKKSNDKTVIQYIPCILGIDSSLTGIYELELVAESHNNVVSTPYVISNIQKDESGASTYEFNDIPAESLFINADNKYSTGYYNVTFNLYLKTDETNGQLIQTIEKDIIVGTDIPEVFIQTRNISNRQDNPTIVFSNINALIFSFKCIHSIDNTMLYDYNIIIEDLNGNVIGNVFSENRYTVFNTLVDINTQLTSTLRDKLTINATYKLKIKAISQEEEFYSNYVYIKYSKSEYNFIEFSENAYANKLFHLDPYSDELQAQSFPNTCIINTKTGRKCIDSKISSQITFFNVTSRTGISRNYNIKSIALDETYFDINEYTYSLLDEDENIKVYPISLSNLRFFTINVCYSTLKYTTNDHTILALTAADGNGIFVKTDGIYVGNGDESKQILTLNSDKITSLYIVYNENTSDGKWDSTTSHYKIYVDGIITYISTTCPFNVNKTTGVPDKEGLRVHVNGYTTVTGIRKELCYCNIYNIDIFSSVLNEIDILGEFINDTVKTSINTLSTVQTLDFNIMRDELNKNYCSYDNETYTISSELYQKFSDNYIFTNDLFVKKDGNIEYVPSGDLNTRRELLERLALPITYIELHSTGVEAAEWTFNRFIATDAALKDSQIGCTFYYWDPSVINSVPISSDTVAIKIQGTSTLTNKIKNLEITFKTDTESFDTVVQDLLFIKDDWIPENSYVLKADIVDSSHSNNASIGRFINDHFNYNAQYADFPIHSAAINNINASFDTLTTLEWTVDKTYKHTVEGFQTLLLVKFHGETHFRNLGIYSFNIGRNAARNLGFERITNVSQYINDSTDKGYSVVGCTKAVAPVILKNVSITTENTDEIHWVENSTTFNYLSVQTWPLGVTQLNLTEENGPGPECRFWHAPTDSDERLNTLFETKYSNTKTIIPPNNISLFKNFVKQISLLPIEGFVRSVEPAAVEQLDIFGKYPAYAYSVNADNTVTYVVNGEHTLLTDKLEDINDNTFNVSQLANYYMLALMFGLIDNLDKNVSFRVYNVMNDSTQSKVYADFYDMDTALGINNVGHAKVSPTVGIKLIKNNNSSSSIKTNPHYPQETFDETIVNTYFSQYQYNKFLPETYSNKLWLSLDSNRMRERVAVLQTETKESTYSIYTNIWFNIRTYLDSCAINHGYTSFIDYFIDEYFSNQIKCGTMLYNYDYLIKYLNDFEQTGGLPVGAEIDKLHGKRIDAVRTWLTEHINYLDTYFYWRGSHTYTLGLATKPSNLNTIVSKRADIIIKPNTKGIGLETEYPVLLNHFSTAGAFNMDTYIPEIMPQNINVVGGNTDIQMSINCVNIIKNLNLSKLNISKFVKVTSTTDDNTNTNFSNFEELNLNNLTIAIGGINFNDFIDYTTNTSLLQRLLCNSTRFSSQTDINLSHKAFLNISHVDIANSINVKTLTFVDEQGTNITQNLKYLNVSNSQIEELTLKNQTQLVLPSINTCASLKYYTINNCNLDNLTDEQKTDVSSYTAIFLSAHNVIKDINIKNTECVTGIRVYDSPQFENLTIDNVENLSTVIIDHCSKLSSVTIKDCESLKSINITYCPTLLSIELFNIPELTSLSLKHDNTLSSIYITENSVKNIKTINIADIAINGFNFYNDKTKVYSEPLHDLNDNVVLDFSLFESLDVNASNNGITINDNTPNLPKPYSGHQCWRYQAYRFPNKPETSYKFLTLYGGGADSIYGTFSNLKNIYGHIKLNSAYWFNPKLQLFVTNTKTATKYYGYPEFLRQICASPATITTITTINKQYALSTVFDHIYTKLKLNDYESNELSAELKNNISDNYGFLSINNIKEFDERLWATNYTVESLNGYGNYNHNTNAQRYVFDERLLQYFLYRFAINKLVTHDSNSISLQRSIAYKPTTDAAQTNTSIKLPNNTFRFFGDKMYTAYQVFFNIGNDIKPYLVTPSLMSRLPKLTTYASIGYKEFLCYNALSAAHNLLTLGGVEIKNYLEGVQSLTLTSETNSDEITDYCKEFFNSLALRPMSDGSGYFTDSKLTSINWFKFANNTYSLSGTQFPDTLKVVNNSFYNLSSDDVFDFSYAFEYANDVTRINKSFGNSTIILEPTSFNKLSNIQELVFNNTNKKIVRKPKNSQDSYDYSLDDAASGVIKIDPEDTYTQDDFNTFLSTILVKNTKLTSTSHLLANLVIPYPNVAGGYTLNKSLLSTNCKLVNLPYFFANQTFKYNLVSGMFETLTAIQNLDSAFSNTVAELSTGINSDIPYKFLYTGENEPLTKTLSGTNLFTTRINSFNDCKKHILQSYTPTQIRENAASYNWSELTTNLSNSGILDTEVFNSLSTELTLTDENKYMYIPTDITCIENYTPVVKYVKVEYRDEDDEIISSTLSLEYQNDLNVAKFVNTLSTIYSNLSIQLWEQSLQISTETHSDIPNYKQTIRNVNSIFKNNPNIQPYTGETITEVNQEYSPYNLLYDPVKKSFTVNTAKNIYKNDDSWSHNGQIYDDKGVYSADLLNTNNYNVVLSDMHYIRSTATTININGTDYSNIASYIKLTRTDTDILFYALYNSNQLQNFNYICSPDLFRYCNPNELISLQSIFENCDILHRCAYANEDNTIRVRSLNTGITGRIPPNLLKPLPNLVTIAKMFKNCYHITGYERRNENTDTYSEALTYYPISTYIIPEEFFAYKLSSLAIFNETFSGMTYYGYPELRAPFEKLYTGNANSPISLSATFANSIWACLPEYSQKYDSETQQWVVEYNENHSNKISLPIDLNYSTIDYAFANCVGQEWTATKNTTENNIINGAFAYIPNSQDSTFKTIRPYMENFIIKEYIQKPYAIGTYRCRDKNVSPSDMYYFKNDPTTNKPIDIAAGAQYAGVQHDLK